MHDIEPFYNWEKYYIAAQDPRSPFYGVEYNMSQYENSIYGYYIHPLWDYIGSETLYVKVLYTHYEQGFTIIELFGEWNDALHNDIMFLKRNVVDVLISAGITRFVLLSENLLNFHGSEDDYYAEWFEDVEDGWIALVNLRDFIQSEFSKYRLDYYVNFGGSLEIDDWRTHTPTRLFEIVNRLIMRRIG